MFKMTAAKKPERLCRGKNKQSARKRIQKVLPLLFAASEKGLAQFFHNGYTVSMFKMAATAVPKPEYTRPIEFAPDSWSLASQDSRGRSRWLRPRPTARLYTKVNGLSSLNIGKTSAFLCGQTTTFVLFSFQTPQCLKNYSRRTVRYRQ
jgi:hypothetical protein